MNPESEAERVRNEYAPGVVRAPVEQVAHKLGATISFEPLRGGISGMVLRRNGRIAIGVNSSEARTRQRFTLAHELGHLLLHPGRALVIDRQIRVNLRDQRSSTATDREEIEANGFAAAFLMPSSVVRAETQRVIAGSPSITQPALVSKLANEFDVSNQAMEIRLTNLGLIHPR